MSIYMRLLWCVLVGAGLWVSWSHTTQANGGVVIQWETNYGSAAFVDTAYEAKPTTDGGFITVGTQNYQIFVVKTNASGQEVWNRTLSYNAFNEGAYSIEETNDGGYIVFGSLFLVSTAEYRPWLIKLDANGNTIWSTEATATLAAPIDSAIIRGIERPDGSFVVVGGSNTFSNPQAPWVLLVSSSGESLNFTQYPEPFPGYGSGTYINKIIPTADGGFALMGNTGSLPGKAFLWKFDATATPDWIQTYETDFFRSAFGGMELASGGYILTGCDLPNCNRTVVLKADGTGDTLWQRTYTPQSGNTQGSDIIPTEDGYLLAQVGYSAAGSTEYTTQLITLDENGTAIAGVPLSPDAASTYLYTLYPVTQGTVAGFIGAGNSRSAGPSSISDVYLVRGTLDGQNTPNQAPTAQPDGYSTDEDQGFTIEAPGVLVNDSDPENDPMTALLVQPAPHGAVALFENGALQYTPNEGFVGTDTFTYRVRDQLNYSEPVVVTVLVNEAVNHTPVTTHDLYRTDKDMPLVIPAPGVLDNDRDADGDALTATVVDSTSHGVLTFAADGSFVYTPTTNYLGSDSFTYTVTDGVNSSAPAVVTIEVVPPNAFTIAWQANFGAAGLDLAYDTAPTSDGGFITVGQRNYNLFVVKTDGNGGLVWQEELSLTPASEGAYSVEETNDGNYIVIGSATLNGATGYRPWLVKLDSNGTLIWSTENGLTQTTDVNSAMIRGIERADGTFIVVGGQNTFTDVQDPWRLIVSAEGAMLDFDLYENPIQGFGAGTYINDLFATSDDGFAFTGYVGPMPGQAFLWKFDTNGEPQWVMFYGNDGLRLANGGRELAQGGYILTGCDSPNCNNATVLKADASGEMVWIQEYTSASGYSFGTDIVEKPDGTFLMSEIGIVAAGDTNYRSALVELDAMGERLTETPLQGGRDATYIQRIRLTDSGFIVAGNMRDEGDADFLLAGGVFDSGNPNSTPVAFSDQYETRVNQPLTISGGGVLLNDFDGDNDPLTSVIYGYAAHGTVTLNGSGGFAYTPHPDFAGMDTFTYIATDGREMSQSATVRIMVTSEVPTAVTLSEWGVTGSDGWVASAFGGILLLAAVGWLYNRWHR